MATVGIRELRQRASEVLRRVEAGETFEVTDRGRPIALLAPLPEVEGLERLRSEGDTTPAEAELDTLPEPLRLVEGARAPSEVLAALRHDER